MPFMIRVMRAKLHGIRVTGANLDYHGSVTLDPEVCRQAGILPTEFVEIWNKATGTRISTYVIYGDPGSLCCVLNGAAARTCQRGDEVIICASDYVNRAELVGLTQTVLTFHPTNAIASRIHYRIADDGRGWYTFSTDEEAV